MRTRKTTSKPAAKINEIMIPGTHHSVVLLVHGHQFLAADPDLVLVQILVQCPQRDGAFPEVLRI